MEFFIIRDGQQSGPHTEDALQAMLKDGSLRLSDMGWRKGLPAWLPLQEVLNPGTARLTEPPPMSSLPSNVKARPATPRQKALLQYIGSSLNGSTTREEAALAICDALENPKLTSRIAKWGEEKLRLHPDLFQEEIDYRRANRITRYLELCQTEAAEVVKDVTKAHVQVLMESLDKRHSTWEEDPRAALWDYLLPSVAENFPQLVRDEWKGKLRMGGTLKVAAAYAGTTDLLPPAPPSAFQAAIRGLVYGVVALGLVIGAIYVFRTKPGSDVARNTPPATHEGGSTETAAQQTPAKNDTPAEASPAAAPLAATDNSATPNSAPLTATPSPEPANPPTPTPTPAPPTPEMTAAAPPQPAEPAAANPPPVAANSAATFTPAPPPPVTNPAAANPVTAPAPAAPSPVVRNSATLTQPVTVQLQFGKVTLNPGTKVRLIALEGENVRVNFNNNIVLMPVASTDIDPANTVIAPPPAVTAAPVIPIPAPTPATTPSTPTAPTTPKSPSDDL